MRPDCLEACCCSQAVLRLLSGMALCCFASADVDACRSAPCAGTAACVDLPPPAGNGTAGRTCNCSVGLVHDEAKGCVEANACLEFGCTAPAICTDLPAPAPYSPLGRNCSCPPGQLWMGTSVGCAEADACVIAACKGSATCQDLPAPAPYSAAGRRCTCRNTALVYVEEAGCVDKPATNVDACLGAPCTQNVVSSAVCTDLPPPASNSSSGRVCTCTANGTSYMSDRLGCVGGSNACAAKCKQCSACMHNQASPQQHARITSWAACALPDAVLLPCRCRCMCNEPLRGGTGYMPRHAAPCPCKQLPGSRVRVHSWLHIQRDSGLHSR